MTPPTVGILGGGQLGRMLALAGYSLGLQFRFYDPDPLAPARYLGEHTVCGYDNAEALSEFASSVDLLTYEFENVPISAARMLENRIPVYPPPAALEVSQDRVAEKTFLRNVGIPVAPFAPIDSDADADTALKLTGLPAVLKTRRMGYDGKGQRIVHTPEELALACRDLGGSGLILEALIPFSAECSLIAARSIRGETCFYPLVENVHRDGILRTSRTPLPSFSVKAAAQMQFDAQAHAGALLSELGYVGVLTIEYFMADGALIANEIAPRVHNSGHWTIEGAETSQFENHLRAILDLPLGSTTVRGTCWDDQHHR